MKGRRFSYKLFVVCLCAALFLSAGCMRAPQPGQPGGPAPAVIEVWHYLQDAEADALQTQVQRIMGQYSEVLIKLKYVPEVNFADFSYQAGAGGEGPEIFIASREIIRRLYERGMLTQAAYVDEGAYPAASAAFQFEGAPYASPWLTDVALLYFRADWAGVPENVEDLFFNKGGVSLAAADMFSLAVWWSDFGGRVVFAGRPVLTGMGNLTFLNQLLNWQMAGSLRVDPAAREAFERGQTSFMIAGASQAKGLTALEAPWGIMQLSDLTGGRGHPLIGSTLGIANSAIKTTEALLPFIRLVEKELLTLETESAMERAGTLIPANMGYYQLPESQKGIFPQVNVALSRAWELEGNAAEWKIIPVMEEAWSKALAGDLLPGEALAEAQEEALKALGVR